MELLIINGPNLNLLGTRDPEMYGNLSFEEFLTELHIDFPDHFIKHFQSNHEGALIDKLHANGFTVDGIILNPGAFAHTSIALRDAVEAITCPVVEVHITDIYHRETFRQYSYIEDVAVRTITGKGLEGYREAILFLDDFATNK